MSYERYISYKDSGVRWLGQVPEHWELKRLKWSIDSCKNGIWGNEPDGEDDIICVRVADFDRQSLFVQSDNLTLRQVPVPDRKGRLLRKGDLLLEKSGGGEKQLVGAVVQYDLEFDALTSNFIAKLQQKKSMHGRYFTYFHSSLYSGRVNYRSIKQSTGIQNLDAQSYFDELATYPPILEQKQIASFLDQKTAEIDQLIAKKQKLLTLLDEQRSSLITQAVTKGLNPNTPMKDSGVVWLGQVPELWDVVSLKRHLQVPVTDGPHETPDFIDDGVPFISAEAIKNSKIDFSKKRGFISFEDDKIYSKKYKPRKGDIYIIKSGATTGRVAMVETDDNFNIWSPLAAIRVKPYFFFDRFVFHYLSSDVFKTAIELSWSFGTQQNIGMNIIENLKIVVPPIKEQNAIVDLLDKKTTEIDLLKNKVQQAIERLQEYRAALITQAVTGQIKVA